MKESKSLKVLKNNILVGLYLEEPFHDGQLAECIYSLANQKQPVDVVILDGGLSDKSIEFLNKTAEDPSIKVLKTDKDGNPTEEIVKSDNSLEFDLVKIDADNFSKVYNDLFNISLDRGYDYFSIIEVGDAVGSNWYKIASVYMEENEDVGFFFPMVRSFKNGVLTGLMNEASWAEGLSEEAGKFDMNLLLRFNCANPLGAIYRVSDVMEYSEQKDGRYCPMKESIKISHYYEFFLRMAYNDVKMMTVPRIGYDFRINDNNEFKHTSSKIPNNLTTLPKEKGGMDSKEISFWVELAKKEYFFDEDRCKTFLETVL